MIDPRILITWSLVYMLKKVSPIYLIAAGIAISKYSLVVISLGSLKLRAFCIFAASAFSISLTLGFLIHLTSCSTLDDMSALNTVPTGYNKTCL